MYKRIKLPEIRFSRFMQTKVITVGNAGELEKILASSKSVKASLEHPKETFNMKMKQYRAKFNVESRKIQEKIKAENIEKEQKIKERVDLLHRDIEHYKLSKETDAAASFFKEDGLAASKQTGREQRTMPESIKKKLEWRRMQRDYDRKKFKHYLSEQKFRQDKRLDDLFFLFHSSAEFANSDNLDKVITAALLKPKWPMASDFMHLESESIAIEAKEKIADRTKAKSLKIEIFTQHDIDNSEYKANLVDFRNKEYADALKGTTNHGLLGPKQSDFLLKARELLKDMKST